MAIGGDKVWAYNPGKSNAPPFVGWVVPFGGEVDRTFRLYPAPKPVKRKLPSSADGPVGKMPKAHADLMETLADRLKQHGGSLQDKINDQKKKEAEFLDKRKQAQADMFADIAEWAANPAEAKKKQDERRKKELEEKEKAKKKFEEEEKLRKQRAASGVGTWKPPAGSSGTVPPPDGKKIGMRVYLQGLKGAPHLNDLEGILVGWLGDKMRWSVRMVSGTEVGECKALKPENVRLVDEDPN